MSDLKEATCGDCGIKFGYPAEMDSHWKASSKVFYCPNGHGLEYPKAKPELDKLRKEIADLKEKLDASFAREEVQKKKIEELTIKSFDTDEGECKRCGGEGCEVGC